MKDTKYIDNQIYTAIPTFNDYYITDAGDILSFKHIKTSPNGRKMSKIINKLGYERVCLMQDKKLKHILVHRLVAETFIPDKTTFKSMPDENRNEIDLDKLEINHKDENKLNNHVSNLEWCTHRYNSNYGTRTARIIPKTIDKTRTPVDQYDDDGVLIKEWYSTNEAARTLGIIQQNITRCCQGKRYHAGGYVWKYHNKGGD